MSKHIKKHTAKREIRVHTAPQRFEIRKNADGSRSISGYAAVFNSLSEDLGGFREKLQPGCFAKSLAETNKDPLCLYGHDSNQILGRVSSGTLSIAEDSIGLKFTCKLPDTSTARDLTALMQRGDLSACSFGFALGPDGDSWEEVGGQIIRTLLQVTLFEVSVVGQPAYSATSVNLRSCPKSLRTKIKRDDDDDLDDDDDDPCDPDSDNYDPDADCDEDRCDCRCEACEAGDCENCDNDSCLEDGNDCVDCGMALRQAHFALLMRRLK